MPIYTFQNPETGKTIDIRQRMTEKHEYTDENGLKWTRVFEVVNVGFDTSPNIFSSTSFADSTSNKKETIGVERWPSHPLSVLGRTRGVIITLGLGIPDEDKEWQFDGTK